jgi:hypothetical protein
MTGKRRSRVDFRLTGDSSTYGCSMDETGSHSSHSRRGRTGDKLASDNQEVYHDSLNLF